jgi:hypothetical protein
MSELLNAVLAALPLLRENRDIIVSSDARIFPDGTPDMSTLDAVSRAEVAEHDRAIALCEEALQKAGLR